MKNRFGISVSVLNKFILLGMGPVGIEPATHGLKVRCSAVWAMGPN